MKLKSLKKLGFLYPLIIFYCLFMLYYSLYKPDELYNSIFSTLDIWLYKVFPSIFMFYIISSLLLSTKIIDLILIIFKPVKKIIRFETDNGFKLFMISLLVGNPSASSFIMNYYHTHQITKKDATDLFKCASFITPLFVLAIFSDDLKLSLTIYFIHVISNVIIACFITRKNQRVDTLSCKQKLNFFSMISNIPNILFTIATLMVICNTISLCLQDLKIPIEFTSFLEISSGVYNLKDLGTTYSRLLIVGLISFNGLCIHTQVYTISKDILHYPDFLQWRIIQALMSIILFFIIYGL